LNPRGFQQQPHQRVVNGFSNNTTPQQQLAFHFDNPAGSPQPVLHAQTSQQYNGNGNNGFAMYANGNGGGMGHMLERIHNVADRDMLPQKRRKVNDDHAEHPRKAEFNGGGKGGVLGDYMREKREEGRQDRVAKGTAVDISTGLFPIILLLCSSIPLTIFS
jgi:hypothetical protein